MVAHWKMRVVWLKGIVWPPEKTPDIEGMIFTGIEIGVVPNMHGNMRSNLVSLEQCLVLQTAVVFQDVCMVGIFGKYFLKIFPHRSVDGSSEGCKIVQGRLGKDSHINIER